MPIRRLALLWCVTAESPSVLDRLSKSRISREREQQLPQVSGQRLFPARPQEPVSAVRVFAQKPAIHHNLVLEKVI
jgi:hypothetical protein